MSQLSLLFMMLLLVMVALLLARGLLRGLKAWLVVWLRATIAGLCLVFSGFCGFLFYDLSQFNTLASSDPIARVSIQAIDEKTYVAKVTDANNVVTHVTLDGDAWQISAKAINWGGVFKMVDARPIYRLDSMNSRYFAFEYHQRGRQINIDRSMAANILDSWSVFNHFTDKLQAIGVRSSKAAAAYLPLRDGAVFEIFYRQDSLVAEAANMLASYDANNDASETPIRH